MLSFSAPGLIKAAVAIAAVIALVAAGAAIASLAAPEGAGAAGPAGPKAFAVERGFTGPAQSPPGPQYTTVVSRELQPGLYAINAKVIVRTFQSTSSDCILALNSSQVDATGQEQFTTTAPSAPLSTHPLQFAGRVRRGASVAVRCRAGSPWQAREAKITAIRLGALTK
jgi:hypothetical protein